MLKNGGTEGTGPAGDDEGFILKRISNSIHMLHTFYKHSAASSGYISLCILMYSRLNAANGDLRGRNAFIVLVLSPELRSLM